MGRLFQTAWIALREGEAGALIGGHVSQSLAIDPIDG